MPNVVIAFENKDGEIGFASMFTPEEFGSERVIKICQHWPNDIYVDEDNARHTVLTRKWYGEDLVITVDATPIT